MIDSVFILGKSVHLFSNRNITKAKSLCKSTRRSQLQPGYIIPLCWPSYRTMILQIVHLNGFSPEWLRLCVARCWLLPQHLPHSMHLYLRLWILICLHRPSYRTSCDEMSFCCIIK